MIRQTGFSGFSRFLTLIAASATALVAISSCSDSTAPRLTPQPSSDGVVVIEYHYPDSVKLAAADASASRLAPSSPVVGSGVSANLVSPGAAALASSAAVPTYTSAAVPFAPETAPTVNVPKICDDCVIAGVPLGFTFNFYGQAYDKINIATNGIVGFGALDATGYPVNMTDGCCVSRFIAQKDANNNIIALGWADWAPVSVKQIRYETRGTAPNRRFLVQYSNVGESGGNGHMTAQLVLYESTNDIVLYTTELNTTFVRRAFTQGIENLAGAEAAGLAGRDSVHFSLANDGVKFALNSPNKAPVITPPSDLSLNTDASVCVANYSVPAPSFTDDAPGATIAGVRSDGLALNAAFPKGTTTITWTATDVGGLKSSVTQNVNVSDKEKPSVTAPQNISTRVDLGRSFATVSVGQAAGADNCPNVQVLGARSDNAPLNAGYPIGVTTITWTATDVSKNTATATQTVTVTGNKPPVVTPPANIAVNTDARACSAIVNPGTATVQDDTDGATVAGVRSDGQALNAAYPKGLTTIHWTATDADGLQAVADQTVTVSDKEKPSVTPPANVSVGNDPSHNYAAVVVGAASAADNCPIVNVSGSRSDGQPLIAVYPVGVTTITWTAVDASGNTASAAQTITVRDVEAPKVLVPNDFSVNATMPSGAVVTYSVTATDNVGVASLSCTPASGNVFPIGYSAIHCVASDAAGNSASGDFGVKVLGASEQILNLMEYVQSLNLQNGAQNPLVNQLRAAQRDGSNPSACTKLDDFVHMVSVKNGSLTSAQSNFMIQETRRIQSVLGCAGATAPASTRVAPTMTGFRMVTR